MVAFDYGRGPTHRDRLYDIWVQSALYEVSDPAKPLRLPLEDLYEDPPDNPPLLLRIDDALQRAHELIRSLDAYDVETHLLLEECTGGFELTLFEESRVHEDAGLLVSNRLVDECSRNGRIDPAREPTDDPLLADLVSNFSHLLTDDRLRRPVRPRPANFEDKVSQDLFPKRRMCHFWVKLHAEYAPA